MPYDYEYSLERRRVARINHLKSPYFLIAMFGLLSFITLVVQCGINLWLT